MTEAGKRLLAAANEALAFAKGEAAPGSYKVHAPPPTVDVKAIRGKMGMTQAVFGERFGFGKARIRDWEQKRTTPAASDRVLLVTIANDPDSVLRALAVHDVVEPMDRIEPVIKIRSALATAVAPKTPRSRPAKAGAKHAAATAFSRTGDPVPSKAK